MKCEKKILGSLVVILLLAFLFTGCGGGGGGGSSEDVSPAYSVGGTVSGLEGSGLVLQCNGSNDLSVLSDGSFTFANALTDGTVYTVTVLKHPENPSQTCSVANGSGTVSGTDVTDVIVTCSVDTYTVGGTVAGLSGTLVLQNNDADDVTITSDGLFTFATTLADGSPYSVTIAASPVLQNCTVTNGNGTISGSDVTDVSVTCVNKSWTHPADLSDNISQYDDYGALEPDAAMDDNGNAVVVWYQKDGTTECVNGGCYSIFKSEYRNGSWTHPADLSDNISDNDNGVHAESPKVAMDNNGNAIIVWRQDDGVTYDIYMVEYRNGNWGAPIKLNIGTSFAYYPEVAMDNNSNAIVIWSEDDDTMDCNSGTEPCSQVFKSEYRNGSWTHPADFSDNISPDGADVSYLNLAMSDSGKAVIVWRSHDGSDTQVYKSDYDIGVVGDWNNPADIDEHVSLSGSSAFYPKVAMDSSGNAVIAWRQASDDFNRHHVFKAEYRGTTWELPPDLTSDSFISVAGESAGDPEVAMDDNGNAVITWGQPDDTTDCNGHGCYSLFKSDYNITTQGDWTDPSSLGENISPDGDNANESTVTMDNNGNIIISWNQQDDSGNSQVFKSEYRNGSWMHPADLSDNISPDGTQTSDWLSVAMDNNGDAIIVWSQEDANHVSQIFMSEFR